MTTVSLSPSSGPTVSQAEARALDPDGIHDDANPQGLSALGRFYAATWRVFCSLKVTVVVLLTLAAGCVVGMFHDQTKSYDEHAAMWASAAWKLRLYTFLELNDVFHSWWFGITIVVLAINLTACSIERLPKIVIDIWNPIRHLTDRQLSGIKQQYRVVLPKAEGARALRVVDSIFGGKAYSGTEGGVSYRWFERHRYARTGVYIVHVSLLTIMGGSIATTQTGIDGMMMVAEGRNGRLVRVFGPGRLPYTHDLGFEVRCEDFRLKTYVDGAPMEFESDLSVWDSESPVNPVLTKTIQVNDPLEYRGYTFYQASYNPIPGDQMVQLDIGLRGKERLTYVASVGETITIEGTRFVPVEVIPEFAGLGAAVRVQETQPDGAQTSYVVFRQYPDFDAKVRRGAFDVQFRGFDQQFATGLQVGRVPWIGVVFGGFLFLFLGMFMAFFMSHRRYWARLTPLPAGADGEERVELIVCGAARRHQFAFDEEFAKIREVLVAAFGKGETTADRARALRDKRKADKEARATSSAPPTE